jgi:hypothetical protein
LKGSAGVSAVPAYRDAFALVQKVKKKDEEI